MAKLTIGKVKLALEQAGGIKAAAARQLNVSRTTLYAFLARHPELQEFLQGIEEEVLDLAESKMLQLIRDGDPSSVRFFLERKGRSRGYAYRVENTGKDGGPIETREKIDLSSLSDAELEQLAKIAARLEGIEENEEKPHSRGRPDCNCAICQPWLHTNRSTEN